MIWSPLWLGARRAWNGLAKSLMPEWAAKGASSAPAPRESNGIILKNSNHELIFDLKTARLISMRAKVAPDQEFSVASEQLPVFVIQHLTAEKQFRQIASTEAKEIKIHQAENRLTADFTGLGGLDLAATVTVRMDGQRSFQLLDDFHP